MRVSIDDSIELILRLRRKVESPGDRDTVVDVILYAYIYSTVSIRLVYLVKIRSCCGSDLEMPVSNDSRYILHHSTANSALPRQKRTCSTSLLPAADAIMAQNRSRSTASRKNLLCPQEEK